VSARDQERKRRFRRKAFHVAIAVILIICAISPFLETAAHWDNTIFATGYDGESTVAVLMILLELVISFAGPVVIYVCRNAEFSEPVVIRDSFVSFDSVAGFRVPEFSPPLPLRI
jgi:hypothetical protein